MAYNKTNWQNGITPINETTLNKIENELESLDTNKQNNLISGTNIKTIQGYSVLGSGNLAIIENTNNNVAKGVKFEDGTLIQYGHYDITTDTNRSAGGLTYYSGSQNITLPYNFYSTDYEIFTNVTLANLNLFCQSYGSPYEIDKFVLSFCCTSNNETRRIDFICIGRWK